MNVDRTGTFRCKLVEKGFSKTKEKTKDEKDPGGYPQLITKVIFTQVYDEAQKEWFGIDDWDMGITAYSCLYGFLKKEQAVGKTLTCQQIMKVFNWDGASLAELITKDDEGLEFQMRTEENDPEYADKTPFQVAWIDVYDADPANTLRKLSIAEVKDLDAQFSNIGASAKNAASAKGASKAPAKPHPARVPADNAKAPVKSKGPAKPKTQAQTQTAEEKKAEMKARSDRVKAQVKKPTVPAASTPPLPDDDNTTPALPEAEGSCTKSEAWNGIFEMRDEHINDAIVKELWDDAIVEVAGQGVTHKDVTGKQWWQVKDIVIKDCGKF